jgi:hypothetical protein
MQKISVGLARSIWLFDTNELNPTGKNLFPDMLLWVGEKYKFQTFPKSLGDVDKEKKGFLFKLGEFQSNEGGITVNLSYFSDGLVAETYSSTEQGDAFLQDLLNSAASKYSLAYRSDMIRTKTYISELVVQLDHVPEEISPKVARFCDTLNGIFARHNLASFEMTGMLFAPDVHATAYKPPGLTIERKAGAPFSANRYWSRSPFTTKEHLFALEEFEKMLAPPSIEISIISERQVRTTD